MVTAIHCDVSEPFQIKAVCHFQDIYRKLVRGHGGSRRTSPSCRSYCARARRPNHHLQCALNVRTQTVRLRKYHGGQYESSSCSRSISHLSAFSGCRIGPGAERPGVPTLRLRTSWLRLLQLRLRLPSPPLRVPSPPLRVPSSPLSLLENFEASPLPAALAVEELAACSTRNALADEWLGKRHVVLVRRAKWPRTLQSPPAPRVGATIGRLDSLLLGSY
jgi:hypothetical protein